MNEVKPAWRFSLRASVVAGACAMALMACPSEPPPSLPPSPYPQAATVSPEQLAEVLPKDPSGAAILLEVAGEALTIGAPRRDAVGAAAKCRDLLDSCLRKTKDPDACARTAPRCQTTTPWTEAAACCAEACIAAYEEERRLGADESAAHIAVFGSTHECFPGLQQLYRAAGGTPYLAPRRAPR